MSQHEFKRFYMNRSKDETGVSGTGRVLEGILTASGKIIVEWKFPYHTIGIYNSLEEFKFIHQKSHPNSSKLVWIDK